MNKPLQHLAVIVEEFTSGSPAQHLLDRMLAGYAHDGQFRQRLAPRIVLHAASGAGEVDAEGLQRRVKELQLELSSTIAEAVHDASAAVLVWRGAGYDAKPEMLELALRQLPPGSACFVHGLLAKSASDAATLAGLAATKGIRLATASASATTFRLPDWRLKSGTALSECLVVVQGENSLAALDGIYALLPELLRSEHGLRPNRSARFFSGEAVWHAGARGDWSWPLLSAALSRTDTLQGEPTKDGRTQDVVQLGLVQTLAKNPRCWLTQHDDNLRSAILVLDGVVTDFNLALQPRRGAILSTQLYRPPAPNREHYSALTYAIESHLRGEAVANSITTAKPDAIATWWETLASASTRPGEEITTLP